MLEPAFAAFVVALFSITLAIVVVAIVTWRGMRHATSVYVLALGGSLKCAPRTRMTVSAEPIDNCIFECKRLIIANAERWIVHQIRVDNVNHLLSGVSGVMFDMPMSLLPRVRAGQPLVLEVEYVGDAAGGEEFRACMHGQAWHPPEPIVPMPDPIWMHEEFTKARDAARAKLAKV